MIATAATFLLAGLGIIPVKQVTLHGVEVLVSGGPSGTQVALIVDVETKFGLAAGILTCDLDHPITTRYKAIGFALGWNAAGVDKLQPTFDATKGYTIDIPNGAIHAVSPLGDLLQVLGVNVSRDNPTYVETEIGLAADLGVVKVDRAKVRARIDAPEVPTLTGLGASIDVGVVKGSGHIEVNPTTGDVAGSLDVTLADPLNLRVMAGLKIAHDPATGALGVFVGMELDLPVPILLGSTGLGIYGFLGGVGVNMRRDEHPDDTIPALAWLQRAAAAEPDRSHRVGCGAGALGLRRRCPARHRRRRVHPASQGRAAARAAGATAATGDEGRHPVAAADAAGREPAGDHPRGRRHRHRRGHDHHRPRRRLLDPRPGLDPHPGAGLLHLRRPAGVVPGRRHVRRTCHRQGLRRLRRLRLPDVARRRHHAVPAVPAARHRRLHPRRRLPRRPHLGRRGHRSVPEGRRRLRRDHLLRTVRARRQDRRRRGAAAVHHLDRGQRRTRRHRRAGRQRRRLAVGARRGLWARRLLLLQRRGVRVLRAGQPADRPPHRRSRW